MNKISYSSLKKTLTKKEMQNVTGGSYPVCVSLCFNEYFSIGLCAFPTAIECEQYGQTSPGCEIQYCLD